MESIKYSAENHDACVQWVESRGGCIRATEPWGPLYVWRRSGDTLKLAASLRPGQFIRAEVGGGFRVESPPLQPSPPEELVTSPTGGQKGRKPAQHGSLDPVALTTLAEVSGFGTRKYARHNYLRGYDWSLSYDALHRHLNAFWSGEDRDPESGLAHAAHAAWHALALVSFLERGIGTDDRPPSAGSRTTGPAASLEGRD
ncbi:MAG: dATP/dGTP diphosphohydrolase domain-containing protein [Dermatophilaceae bacterium]